MEEKYLERFIGMEKDIAAITENVGEIKSQQAEVRKDVSAIGDKLDKVVSNHEERIACLERVQPAALGSAKVRNYTAAGGAGVGIGVVIVQVFEALRPVIERIAHGIK